jgi:hypothetical protein
MEFLKERIMLCIQETSLHFIGQMWYDVFQYIMFIFLNHVIIIHVHNINIAKVEV